MKRKAATRPASKQPANKMSSSKGKQVAGTPVDTDQEADEVLRANASSQKVCSRFAVWQGHNCTALRCCGARALICHYTCAVNLCLKACLCRHRGSAVLC